MFLLEHGDLTVYSTGYYGDNEVEAVELAELRDWTYTATPEDRATVLGCVLLPGSEP